MQRTLILLKPDCVHRRLVGTVLQRFEQKGLRLVGLKFVQAGRDLAERHYAVHKGKPFYESLLSFLTAGPTVALVLEGREAVAAARNPLYLVLLLVSLLFVMTALAYALIPVLEQKAAEAGNPPPPSPFREGLRQHGGTWLLCEVAAMVVVGLLSMALDRLRALKKE